ncbi:hypothetical protein [Paenibacillus auburnensis]|uniref:hypothetical protein n=1 Tax=Paenibacillus auburnensis TaxID=2905649 RepID=UPI001F216DB0|nr:hypothetical protein [Paenibacillus auburnensis]
MALSNYAVPFVVNNGLTERILSPWESIPFLFFDKIDHAMIQFGRFVPFLVG